MLRGENIVAGTTTTGSGILTFAACPSSIGALDFYQYLATDVGIANSKAILVPYTMIEYVDSNFAKPSQVEKGIGTVTIGANLAATTLARTTIQVTQTGTTYNDSGPTALTIGTAANVLVFIGASAVDIPAFDPYYEASLGAAAFGATPIYTGSSAACSMNTEGTGTDWYSLFTLSRPVAAKVCRLRVTTAYSGGGTPVSTCYAAIYEKGSNGRPGNLIADFGSFGTNPMNTGATVIATSALAAAVLLQQTEYFLNVFATFTGATGPTPPTLTGYPPLITGALSFTTAKPITSTFATGGSRGTAPNPANVTSYAIATGFSSNNTIPLVGFANS